MVYKTEGVLQGLNLELSQTSVNKLLKEIREGDTVKIEVEIGGQSYVQLKAYMARLGEISLLVSQEKHLRTFYNLLLEDLVINGQINSDLLHTFIKKILGKPSFSFTNLPSQKKRNEFVNEAFEVCSRWEELLNN